MLLFCSHLKSVLFVSFHAYFISKVIISITYLAFHTRYSIIRYANGFSDNCNYCDVAEEKLNFNKTNSGGTSLETIEHYDIQGVKS